MIYASQARAISRQKNYNYLVELECKKIDEQIRDSAAKHIHLLYQSVDGRVIEQVMEILERAGYRVTRLFDTSHNASNELKIEWSEQ